MSEHEPFDAKQLCVGDVPTLKQGIRYFAVESGRVCTFMAGGQVHIESVLKGGVAWNIVHDFTNSVSFVSSRRDLREHITRVVRDGVQIYPPPEPKWMPKVANLAVLIYAHSPVIRQYGGMDEARKIAEAICEDSVLLSK